MTVVTFILWFCVLFWFYFIWSRRKFYIFSFKMPGPIGLPFLGVLHRLVPIKDIFNVLPTFASAYKSKSAFMWIGIVPYFYTYDPNVIEKILSSRNCLDKTDAFAVLDKEIGQGLLSSKTKRWSKHRKLLSPTFHQKVLLTFYPIFNTKSKELVDIFDKIVDCERTDLIDLFQKFTIETALATTMDVQLKSDNERDNQYISHVQNHLKLSIERSLAPWRKINVIFYFNKFYNSYVASRNFIYNFVTNFINEKLQKTEKEYQSNCNNEEKVDITKSRRIFIDQAIELYRTKLFSWNDVFIESNVLILAAFETSASTLYSILMLLAMHSEYQEKLFEEIKLVFPDKNSYINDEDLKNLVYMDMVINETLRVVATIPLLGREATDDVQISDDISIPKGTSILIDILNLHRDKDIWGQDAKKFNPDNFLHRNQAERHPFAFIPFSKGPRNCIGYRYADIFLKIMLSKIIYNFKITTEFPFDDLEFTMNMSLRFKTMPTLKIQRR